MSSPLSIERCVLPFSHAQSLNTAHVALPWRDAVILWGGQSGGIVDDSKVYCHQSGKWTAKQTSGSVPQGRYGATAEVLNDKMFVLGGENSDSGEMHSLDLNTWTWALLRPSGTPPSRKGHMSWVHEEKIYCFGGGYMYDDESNELLCYNTVLNSWEHPCQGGDVPSPRRRHQTIVSGDTVFLFGGIGYEQPQLYNDLFTLDMVSKQWKRVHATMPMGEGMSAAGQRCQMSSGTVPSRWGCHTLTRISATTAVLFGAFSPQGALSYGSEAIDDCWLLDLESAKQLKGPTSIWTRVQNHFLRWSHVAVQEPASKGLWVIGGFDGQNHVSEVLRMSYNLVPLKTLAMDRVVRSTSPDDSSLQPGKIPTEVREEIESYRNEGVYICSAKKGCRVAH